MDEFEAQSHRLRKDLENWTLGDFNGLDPEELRQRVVRLVQEMQDNTKWEVRVITPLTSSRSSMIVVLCRPCGSMKRKKRSRTGSLLSTKRICARRARNTKN